MMAIRTGNGLTAAQEAFRKKLERGQPRAAYLCVHFSPVPWRQ